MRDVCHPENREAKRAGLRGRVKKRIISRGRGGGPGIYTDSVGTDTCSLSGYLSDIGESFG
jgi:hypothetical protein